MKNDLLGQVRDHLRGERADDAALEAVARGETGTETVAELELRAQDDREVAALVAASRPLGADVEARIAARVTAEAAPAKAGSRPTAPRPNVVSFARRVGIIAGPLALAAAVLLWVLAGRNGETARTLLPDYAVSATSDQTMRGVADPPSAALRLHVGDAPFEIVLRPATTAGVKVVAYAFAIAIGEGEPNPIEAKVEIAPEGGIRIRGRAGALVGAREVRIVIGVPTGAIKRFDDALARARDARSDASVRVITIPILRE